MPGDNQWTKILWYHEGALKNTVSMMWKRVGLNQATIAVPRKLRARAIAR